MSGPLLPPKGYEGGVDFGEGRDYSVRAVYEEGKLIELARVNEASSDSLAHLEPAAALPSQPAASE